MLQPLGCPNCPKPAGVVVDHATLVARVYAEEECAEVSVRGCCEQGYGLGVGLWARVYHSKGQGLFLGAGLWVWAGAVG